MLGFIHRTLTVIILLCGILVNATGSNVDDPPEGGNAAQGGDRSGVTLPTNISKTWQRVTNAESDKALREFCSLHNLSIEEHGTYPVMVLLIGGVKVPTIDADLKLGVQVLTGLESWTGRQEYFLRKHPGDGETIELAIFSSDADYDSYLDFYCAHRALTLRTDSNFFKPFGAFGTRKLGYSRRKMLDFGPSNLVANMVTIVALRTYAQGYDLFNPHLASWILEGSSIEMQHLLCGGIIRFCYGASDFSDKGVLPSEMWAQFVARKINHGDQDLINAETAMLDFTAPPSYSINRQVWSFFTFIKARCGSKTGAGNKLMNIIKAVAQGTSSAEAIKAELNLKDPALTGEWQAWAANQR